MIETAFPDYDIQQVRGIGGVKGVGTGEVGIGERNRWSVRGRDM